MSAGQPVRQIPPNFRTPRLVGIFNILFATQILIGGLCMAGYIVTLPMWGRLMSQVQKEAEQQQEKRKQQELAALAEQEKVAKTEAEKAEVATKRKEVENRPKIPMTAGMMDFSKMGFTDPMVLAWSWTEAISGILLNIMLTASGVGLLTWKSWARKLGVWTSVLKILRLVVMYSLFIILIVPPLSKNLGAMIAEMMLQQQAAGAGGGGVPGGDPATFFAQIYTITYTGMGVGFMLGGAIYPAIVIWLLTRPGVKVACSGVYLPPKEPKQP